MDKNEAIRAYEKNIKRVLISEEEIHAGVARAGAYVDSLYDGNPILLVSILKGAFVFLADLCRAVKVPCEVGFMCAKSYYSGTVSTGAVKVTMDLEQDGLLFRNPLHQAMLHSVLLRLDDEGFSAERFLLSHPDTAVSQLAAELLSDRHQLSKFNEQALTKDEERLHELVPRLLMDFKRSVVDDELKGIMAELQHPEVLASPERAMEVMKRYKELSDTARELAKRCGERVILGK